jgi:hypothetical protein
MKHRMLTMLLSLCKAIPFILCSRRRLDAGTSTGHTPTYRAEHSRVVGYTLHHWTSVPQHLENYGAFIFKGKESRRIISGLMVLESKCSMIL